MKILHLLLPIFFIPLVNGMDFPAFELEQTVGEHTMTSGDTYSSNTNVTRLDSDEIHTFTGGGTQSSDVDVIRLDSDGVHTLTGGDTQSSDVDVIRLDSDEVKPSSPSKRPKAIIALTLLAVLLILTFYTVTKLKAKPLPEKIERFEQELANFREHVRDRQELDDEELRDRRLTRLTPGQKVTLELIEEKIKLFKEGKFIDDFFFFEEEIKEHLMEFFVQELKDGDDFDEKEKDFEALFPDYDTYKKEDLEALFPDYDHSYRLHFFDLHNYNYAQNYFQETGGKLKFQKGEWVYKPSKSYPELPSKLVYVKKPIIVSRVKEFDYTKKEHKWKEHHWKL